MVNMSQIINHDYLKQAMEEKVNKNAQEMINIKVNKKTPVMNKAATLRSKSVARYIKKFDFEQHMEEMRTLKAHHNSVSFADIEKNEFKNRKEL